MVFWHVRYVSRVPVAGIASRMLSDAFRLMVNLYQRLRGTDFNPLTD
jgi:hypothetical protein